MQCCGVRRLLGPQNPPSEGDSIISYPTGVSNSARWSMDPLHDGTCARRPPPSQTCEPSPLQGESRAVRDRYIGLTTVICVEAGMALDPALSLVAERLGGTLGAEIGEVLHDLSLGTPRADAYRARVARTGAPELAAAARGRPAPLDPHVGRGLLMCWEVRMDSPAGNGRQAGRRYAAFISYSRAADSRLAPALRLALQRFAKPWYRPRALRVFQDDSSLSANPGLWSSVVEGARCVGDHLWCSSPRRAPRPRTGSAREIEHLARGAPRGRSSPDHPDRRPDRSGTRLPATSDFEAPTAPRRALSRRLLRGAPVR